MSGAMAPASNGKERPQRLDQGTEARRSRARRNALLLALVAAGLYLGFILFGSVIGVFPG
jgi:hypothetical protein